MVFFPLSGSLSQQGKFEEKLLLSLLNFLNLISYLVKNGFWEKDAFYGLVLRFYLV
jgi:hypothetical protein